MTNRFIRGTRRDNYLTKHSHDMSATELAAHFGVTKSAVLRRERKLGIPKKTETYHQPDKRAEIALILEKVNKIGPSAVVAELKRTEQAIRVFCKCRKIRITFSPTWSRSQIKFIKANGPLLTVEQLAIELRKAHLLSANTPMSMIYSWQSAPKRKAWPLV